MFLSVLSLALLLHAGPLASDPDDLEKSFKNLQQAEAAKDAAEVKKLAVQTITLAREYAAAPAPEEAEAKAAWPKQQAWARDIQLHAEYALYAAALGADPAVALDLFVTLEQASPKSKYMNEAYPAYFAALTKNGAAAKIPAVAEKGLVNFPDNEDILLVLADTAINNKQSDRALAHAVKLQSVLATHKKPEGMAAADWERKRGAAALRAHFIAGLV